MYNRLINDPKIVLSDIISFSEKDKKNKIGIFFDSRSDCVECREVALLSSDLL